MKGKYISLYEKNHLIKNNERLGLFQIMNENYLIKKVLYPGCYVHITPSFIFPEVIFNDMYKNLQNFYDSNEIFEYIKSRKSYSREPYYSYICMDFTRKLPIKPLAPVINAFIYSPIL